MIGMVDDLTMQKVLRVFVQDPTAKLAADQIKSATDIGNGLHPVLFHLEDVGWLQSVQEDLDPTNTWKPRRRLYGLTRKGLQEAQTVLSKT